MIRELVIVYRKECTVDQGNGNAVSKQFPEVDNIEIRMKFGSAKVRLP